MLNPFYIKIKVFCKDENEARSVQNAVTSISSGINLIGSDLISFNSFFLKNEGTLKPLIFGAFNSFKKGIGDGVLYVTSNIRQLFKLKF